jgi:hypothetical protein
MQAALIYALRLSARASLRRKKACMVCKAASNSGPSIFLLLAEDVGDGVAQLLVPLLLYRLRRFGWL